MNQRLIVVGATGSSHVGGSFVRAAQELGLEAELCDVTRAWRHGTVRQKVLWRFAGKRPLRLASFSDAVVKACERFRPATVLTTGNAPVSARYLRQIRDQGVCCINFSTDDPFNPHMQMDWFRDALPEYDVVFTPRRANIGELRAHGCRNVEYLPFGYDSHLFYKPERVLADDKSDLFFAGAAAVERLPFIAAAVKAGLDVRLHGTQWNRYRETRAAARGHADIATLRAGIAGCRVALCVVRHENRDGHSMRTFEVPAVGASMVVEDTAEHREIFGDEGERVIYFGSPAEMVEKTQYLLASAETRHRLRNSAHLHITQGKNTYADRLRRMLGGSEVSP